MISINKVLLLGEIKKDPETKYFNNGGFVMILNIVTNINNSLNKKNIYNKYNWHRIILNENLIKKNKKQLKVGVFIFIVGKIKTRSWVNEDRNNYITEIIAEEVQIVKENNNYNQENIGIKENKEWNKNQYNFLDNNYKNNFLIEKKNNEIKKEYNNLNSYKNSSSFKENYKNYKDEEYIEDTGIDYSYRDSDNEEEIEEENDDGNYNDDEYEIENN